MANLDPDTFRDVRVPAELGFFWDDLYWKEKGQPTKIPQIHQVS